MVSPATPMVRYLSDMGFGFFLFAFLLNLIREIIKDAEDLEGDQALEKKLFPWYGE